MKKYILLLNLTVILFLVACSNSNTNDASASTNLENNENIVEEPEAEPITEEEAEKLVTDTLTDLLEVLEEARFYNVYTASNGYFHSVEDAKEAVEEADGELLEHFEEIEKTFEKYFHIDKREEWFYDFIYRAFQHDMLLYLSFYDMQTRLQLEEQDEDTFLFSFIGFEDEDRYLDSGTYYLTYKKEDENWKFLDYDFISAEDQPLNLTEEEVEGMGDNPALNFMDYEVEILDVVEENDETFIVYHNKALENHPVVAISTKDARMNFEISERYEKPLEV